MNWWIWSVLFSFSVLILILWIANSPLNIYNYLILDLELTFLMFILSQINLLNNLIRIPTVDNMSSMQWNMCTLGEFCIFKPKITFKHNSLSRYPSFTYGWSYWPGNRNSLPGESLAVLELTFVCCSFWVICIHILV